MKSEGNGREWPRWFSVFTVVLLEARARIPLARAFSEVTRTVHSNFSFTLSPVQGADRLENQSFSERLHKTKRLYLEEGPCPTINTDS